MRKTEGASRYRVQEHVRRPAPRKTFYRFYKVLCVKSDPATQRGRMHFCDGPATGVGLSLTAWSIRPPFRATSCASDRIHLITPCGRQKAPANPIRIRAWMRKIADIISLKAVLSAANAPTAFREIARRRFPAYSAASGQLPRSCPSSATTLARRRTSAARSSIIPSIPAPGSAIRSSR